MALRNCWIPAGPGPNASASSTDKPAEIVLNPG